MKDSRLWQMRLRGERDTKLSHPAFRLLSRLVSDRVNSRDGADDEFPLPWSKIRVWIKREEKRAYSYIREVESRGYIKKVGIKGCPAQCFYKFTFRGASWGNEGGEGEVPKSPTKNGPSSVKKEGTGSVKKEGTGSVKKEGTGSVKKEGASSVKKGGHHISKSFRQGRVIGSGKPSPEGGGKESTSLRSQRKGVKRPAATAADDDKLARDRALESLRKFREKEFGP